MSVTAMQHAFKAVQKHDLSPKAAHVLTVLAWHHSQDTGRCDPSNRRLSALTRLSERAVRMALRELEDAGLVRTKHRTQSTGRGRKNRTNSYVFVWNRQIQEVIYGAPRAGRVGHDMPPERVYTARARKPGAPWDLVLSCEPEEGGAGALCDHADDGPERRHGEPVEDVAGALCDDGDAGPERWQSELEAGATVEAAADAGRRSALARPCVNFHDGGTR